MMTLWGVFGTDEMSDYAYWIVFFFNDAATTEIYTE